MSASNGITIFMCGRGQKTDTLKCTTLGCKNFSSTSCTFKLAGKREGQLCGRALCAWCASTSSTCLPHVRLLEQRAATGRG
jgi:hypothetical protein